MEIVSTIILVILLSVVLTALTLVPLTARYTIGNVGNLSCLNPKITYRVTKQVLTDEGHYTVILRNAISAIGTGQSRWVKIPNPLSPDVILVKVVEDEKWKRELVPIEPKKAETAEAKKADE